MPGEVSLHAKTDQSGGNGSDGTPRAGSVPVTVEPSRQTRSRTRGAAGESSMVSLREAG